MYNDKYFIDILSIDNKKFDIFQGYQEQYVIVYIQVLFHIRLPIQSRPLNSTFPYFLVFLLGPSIQLNYLPIACNDHYWQISISISGCLFFEITQQLQIQNFSFSGHSILIPYLSTTYFINALQNVICNATIETNTSFIMIILQHFFTPRVHFSNQC